MKSKPIIVNHQYGNWAAIKKVASMRWACVCQHCHSLREVSNSELHRKEKAKGVTFCKNCREEHKLPNKGRKPNLKKSAPIVGKEALAVITSKKIFGTKDHGLAL